MRGALVPPTWRICWVQNAHCAHGRAGCAGDLHQERISRDPDAVGTGRTEAGGIDLPVGAERARPPRQESLTFDATWRRGRAPPARQRPFPVGDPGAGWRERATCRSFARWRRARAFPTASVYGLCAARGDAARRVSNARLQDGRRRQKGKRRDRRRRCWLVRAAASRTGVNNQRERFPRSKNKR